MLPVHNFCPEAKLSMEGRALSQHLKTSKKLPVSSTHSFTRGNKRKCKGVVEDVDVRFCSENSLNKHDLGNKYEEADKEGKECCQAKYIAHYLCNMKRKDTNVICLKI